MSLPDEAKQNFSLCLHWDKYELQILNRENKYFLKILKIFDVQAFACKDFFMNFYFMHTLWKYSVNTVILLLCCRWTVCNILYVILDCFPQGFTDWCETGLDSPTFYWSNWTSGTMSTTLWAKPEGVPLPGCENSKSQVVQSKCLGGKTHACQ